MIILTKYYGEEKINIFFISKNKHNLDNKY